MKVIVLSIQFIVSLFLATQAWAWVRILGSIWANGESIVNFVGGFLMSVALAKIGLYAFVIAFIPAAALFTFVKMELKGWVIGFAYIWMGAVLSFLYMVYITNFRFTGFFFLHQAPIVTLAGVLSSLIFYSVSELPVWDRFSGQKESLFDKSRRRYLLTGAGTLAGSTGLVLSFVGPFRIWKHSSDFVDVDVSKMGAGQKLVVAVAGRPVVVVKRTTKMLKELSENDNKLYDPLSKNSKQPASMRNTYRSIKPEYFVADSICTHLGCNTTYMPDGMTDGLLQDESHSAIFFCPCHGGVFDMAGRVYKDTPPPTNLVIPDYEFVSDTIIRVNFPKLADRWNT